MASISPSQFRAAPCRIWLCVIVALGTLALGAAENPQVDLSPAEIGKLPADVQAITGGFRVVEFEKQKVLELPGEPLDVFGLLFGPGEHAALDVRARAWSASSGRRFPEFGIGTGDVGGYRLLLLPGQNRLELRRGDDPIKSVESPAPWRPATWTRLRLRLAKKADGRWSVEGKSWPADAAEPRAWQLSHEVAEAPEAGRGSVWAVPFSGQPIRFAELTASPSSP